MLFLKGQQSPRVRLKVDERINTGSYFVERIQHGNYGRSCQFSLESNTMVTFDLPLLITEYRTSYSYHISSHHLVPKLLTTF